MPKKYLFTLFPSKNRAITAWVACMVLSVTGCGEKAPQDNRYVFSQVQRTSTSRVWMPPAGGQTIQPPVLMNDVYSLWAPLSQQERRQAQVSPRVTRFQSSFTAIAWLPPTEVDIMQDYLFRLVERRREVTNKALQRATAHLPVVLEGLQALNLPQELACLPLVESAFEPGAVSSAGAAGIWQLMPGTARRFGLTVNKEIDERFNVARATMAACAYLAYLYQTFGDWPLALAAYNYGEGNMQRAVDYTGERTLEGIMRWMAQDPTRPRVLPEETRRFVPSFAAAVVLMTQTDNLGIAAVPLVRLPGHRALPPVPPRTKAQGLAQQQSHNNQEAFAPGTYRGPAVQNTTQKSPPVNAPLTATPTTHPLLPVSPKTQGLSPAVTTPQPSPAPGIPGALRSSAEKPAASPSGGSALTVSAQPVVLRASALPAPSPVPPLLRQQLPSTGAGNAPVAAVKPAPQSMPPSPSAPQPQPSPLHTRRTFSSDMQEDKGAAQKRFEEKYVFQPGQSQPNAPQGGPAPTKPLRMKTQEKPVPPATAAPASMAPKVIVPPPQPKPAPPLAVSPAPVPKALPTPVSNGPKPYTSPFPALEKGTKKAPPKAHRGY